MRFTIKEIIKTLPVESFTARDGKPMTKFKWMVNGTNEQNQVMQNVGIYSFSKWIAENLKPGVYNVELDNYQLQHNNVSVYKITDTKPKTDNYKQYGKSSNNVSIDKFWHLESLVWNHLQNKGISSEQAFIDYAAKVFATACVNIDWNTIDSNIDK